MKKFKKKILFIFLALILLYGILLIPDKDDEHAVHANNLPYAWNRNNLWDTLEKEFSLAKSAKKSIIDSGIKILFEKEEKLYRSFADSNREDDLPSMLNNYFSLAALIAAQPEQRDSFIGYYVKVRNKLKEKSRGWDMDKKEVRNTMYQMIYGMRAAEEEVLLQTDTIPFKNILSSHEEVLEKPSATIFGIKVYSGDLLVSRGGAEVSALISRGNDYPGNFSHVALVYIDEKNIPYLIEAHIEKGVAVSSVEQYEKDKKLRLEVLRIRKDLPELIKNPNLPADAARQVYEKAIHNHIPYDFKMDFSDTTAMFCSEVGSYAYQREGIRLWQGISTISSKGIVEWLHEFGVDNFVTQMPSDLEYDPQLNVIAEWRDHETLLKDHIDNAVIDVLLEVADQGVTINYNIFELPLVRIIKAWCMLKNKFGGIGIIPEGMSATQALKNQSFVAMFGTLKESTINRIDEFTRINKYRPPYWQIIKLCRESKKL